MKSAFLRKSAIGVLAVCSLLLPSCVSTKNVSIADASVLRGKTIVRTERKMPAMAAMTPGKAVGVAFGPIGGAIAGAAMVSAGNEILATNRIGDPAVGVGKDLVSGLEQKHGMKSAGTKFVSNDKPQEIAKVCGQADYALDVRTLFWQFGYRPMRLGTYWMTHTEQMRLIECSTGKVVAEGFYAWNPSDEAHFYDYETLVENGAVGLKKEIKSAGDGAKGHFRGLLKY